tara:strand:+ start:488 stop:1282 length:795 start_codon:yes stop_codon:yes gene_type:complete
MATQTELTQAQHVFLQAMMARCVMSETDARAMYAEIVGADVARADARGFDRFWGEIASQLGYLDLDLRRVKYQDDDELYLGIVNKVASDSAKLATTMTPEQIALFRVVLDEVLREDATCDAKNGGVDVISALNATQIWTVRASHHHSFRHTSAFIQIKSNQIKSNHALTNRIESRGTQGATQGATQGGEGGATQLTQAQTESVAKMSKTEKEATLKRLCEEGWLRRGDDEAGKLTIGVRSFLELKDFLLESAPEATQERWKLLM